MAGYNSLKDFRRPCGAGPRCVMLPAMLPCHHHQRQSITWATHNGWAPCKGLEGHQVLYQVLYALEHCIVHTLAYLCSFALRRIPLVPTYIYATSMRPNCIIPRTPGAQ